MKALKKILVLFTFLFILPVVVQAGSIRFNEPEKVSNTSYKFNLTIQDMELNHISGKISTSNGTISKIEMSSGWMNKTGNNNQFYFYHNGTSTGNYTIATIYVTMTGDSEYRISDVDYGVFKCSKDVYGTYFGSKGEVVSEGTFQSVCGKSKDATLKSLSISSGALSPNFSPSLEIYSATVLNNVSAVTFYPTTNHSKAKVLSGTNCALNVGLNTCKIVVQAESGDTKTYSVTILRKGSTNTGWQLSSDASIRDLKVHNGTLTSSFSLSKTEYDVKVSKDTHQIYFSFVMNSNGQSMKSDACGITPDTSKCKLTVTAEDGVSTKTYTFNILHEGKENNGNGNTNNENNVSVVKPTNPSSGSSSSTSTSNSSVENNPSNSNPSHSTTINNDTQNNNNNNNNVGNEEHSNLQESEEHYYSENPKEDIISIPIINKEIKASIFYPVLTVVILLSGVGLGFILACLLKKIVKKR